MSGHIKKARGTNSWPVDVDATPALRYQAEARMAKWITHALAAVTDDDV
jgi:hypothetical protein